MTAAPSTARVPSVHQSMCSMSLNAHLLATHWTSAAVTRVLASHEPPSPCAGERPDEAESEEDERAVRAREKQTAFEALQHSRTLLPMYEYREGLLEAIEKFQTLVIVGETGSGKTTQVCHPCACGLTAHRCWCLADGEACAALLI